LPLITPLEEFWRELGRRTESVRSAYEQAHLRLNEGGPLANALTEARELADGVKSEEPPNDRALFRAVEAAQVVYAIADSIETCQSVGLDISRQLSQMSTGTIDFGTPGTVEERNIFFKDFEYELFVASALIKSGLQPNFLEDPNDPIGEMEVNGLIVECKHPNVTRRLMQNITKFGRELLEADRFGIFAVGIEDAYQLGDVATFANKQEYDDWLERKRDVIEIDGLRRAEQAWGQDRILGLVHTQTKLLIVDGQAVVSRLGNAMLFDDKVGFASHELDAYSVARAFNPTPHLHSEYQRSAARSSD
jgi:hypothetical protein